MLKRKSERLNIIPEWLPEGAKKAATLIINKVNNGKEPKILLSKLKRLIDDKIHIEAMWKKLEKSAIKAAGNGMAHKENTDDKLFMYLRLSVYGDTYFRQMEKRKAARKNELVRYQKISKLAKKLLQEINSPYRAKKMLDSLLIDDLTPALDRYYIDRALDKKIQKGFALVREEYASIIRLPKTLEQLESILSIAVEAMELPSCTMPYKQKAKNVKVTHFILILKEYVKRRFYGKLYSQIALTTELALNPPFDVSSDLVKRIKRNIILKKKK